jgi:hypothetical protein
MVRRLLVMSFEGFEDAAGDYLKSWFDANFPMPTDTDKYEPPEEQDIPSEDEVEYGDYDPDADEDGGPYNMPDPFGELQHENEQLKAQLEEAKENGRKLMDAMHTLSIELQHYQDASPLLYRLLTDLDLDVYQVAEYELLTSGTIATEHDEMSMTWTLRRIPPTP